MNISALHSENLKLISCIVMPTGALEHEESQNFLPNGFPRYHMKVLFWSCRESINVHFYYHSVLSIRYKTSNYICKVYVKKNHAK